MVTEFFCPVILAALKLAAAAQHNAQRATTAIYAIIQ